MKTTETTKQSNTPSGNIKIKVRLIIMSHLSDMPLEQDRELIQRKSEFCKWLLLRYTDTSVEVNPDLVYNEFSSRF